MTCAMDTNTSQRAASELLACCGPKALTGESVKPTAFSVSLLARVVYSL